MDRQTIDTQDTPALDRFLSKRLRRLLQIIMATAMGLSVALAVSSGTTRTVLFFGVASLLVAAWFARKKKDNAAAAIFLSSLTIMVSILVWDAGGINDIAMMGYPIIFMFAVILGNTRIFLMLLGSISAYCSLLAFMTMKGYYIAEIPPVGFPQLIFVNVILLLTGFSVFLLFRDLKRLMRSLRYENARVKEREQQIVKLANQDQLTELPNRRYAESQFYEMIGKLKKPTQKLAMFFFDLDNFKPVNDSLGHAAGDQLLKHLAERLKSASCPNDVVCRFGGDEFLWLKIIDAEDECDLKNVVSLHAHELLISATTPFFIMQNQIDISGSVGVAIAPEHGQEFGEIFRAADLAMYHAKSKGRNTYSLYFSELNRMSVDRFQMLKRMREAIRNNEFQLYYQPKYNLQTGKIIGCEALIRWQQEDGQFIPPDQFIPLAESSGLIIDIGKWVIEKACRDYMQWREAGFEYVSVAVNVSYIQFRDGRLPRLVEHMLRSFGMPNQSLEIELTESLLISNDDALQKQLDQLHEMGVSLAIDDFGTGYSNLGYLRRFNASRLKIDKSFVSALGVSQRDTPLVKAIVQMASSLGLTTIAEGVETEACLQELQALGCVEGQGYLWSKPLPLNKWLEFLRQQSTSTNGNYARPPVTH